MSEYLKPEHPSYGCGQAWFLLAVKNHRGPGLCRLLLVEAQSEAAVAFVERVADDGRVSDTASVMAVFRSCDSVGIRSDLAEEVGFADFANDIVDRARVDRDPLAVRAYREATSGSPSVSPPPGPAKAGAGRNYEEVMSILKNLGFGDAAPAALARLGDIESMPVRDALQAAIDICREGT